MQRWIPPLLFILIWSSGYIAAKLAAPYAEPLWFLVLRYLGVVLLMLALALLFGVQWPSRRAAIQIALAGIGIQAIYLGGVWMAIKLGMSAGLTALIVNLQPVLTAAVAPLVHERVNARQWVGVALGLGGVMLVVWHKLAGAVLAPLPVLLAVASLLGITAGTLYQKRMVPQFDLRAGQVLQFSASLLVTLPVAWFTAPYRIEWNAQVLLSMAWSIVVLTGAGISLMFYMLRHGQATVVTSTMYLAPAVTAAMAWAAFGETLSVLTLVGMAVTLLGVYLVLRNATPANAAQQANSRITAPIAKT